VTNAESQANGRAPADAAPGSDGAAEEPGTGGPPRDEARRRLRHELRTPVHHILGCSELLLEEAEDEGLAAWVPALHEIHAAGKQALLVINDSLDPARDAGPLDLAAVRDALSLLLQPVIVRSAALEAEAATLEREDVLPDLLPIRLAAQRLLALVDAPVAPGGEPTAAESRPAAPSPGAVAPASPPAPVAAAAPRVTGTLLVVDDNQVNRDMLSGRLERDGHTVVRAADGQQALDILASTAVDLVLLDIQMPVLNGYEVLARRRDNLPLRDIPFLVISASDDMESVLSCIELGAEDYLPKPFDPVLLRARIGACLERKHLRDEAERLREEAERKARADLERAQAIQQRLLPTGLDRHWPGRIELAARFHPAKETSGDFYDVFELVTAADDAPPGATPPLQLAVADVAGKSVPAALVGALARTTLRAVAQYRLALAAAALPAGGETAALVPSPAETMRLTGETLHRDVGARDFVACALAVLEPPAAGQAGPRLRLVNAAQVPPILCRAGRAEELEPPGDRLPLGVLPSPQYEELALDLQPGDVLVFSSDGLVEAPRRAEPSADQWPSGAGGSAPQGERKAGGSAADGEAVAPRAGELFGFERLADAAAAASRPAANAEEIAAGIWAAVNDWSGGQFDHDDMTLVVLRVVGA